MTGRTKGRLEGLGLALLVGGTFTLGLIAGAAQEPRDERMASGWMRGGALCGSDSECDELEAKCEVLAANVEREEREAIIIVDPCDVYQCGGPRVATERL